MNKSEFGKMIELIWKCDVEIEIAEIEIELKVLKLKLLKTFIYLFINVFQWLDRLDRFRSVVNSFGRDHRRAQSPNSVDIVFPDYNLIKTSIDLNVNASFHAQYNESLKCKIEGKLFQICLSFKC